MISISHWIGIFDYHFHEKTLVDEAKFCLGTEIKNFIQKI